MSNEKLAINGWQEIGFIAGNGTANAPKAYSFTDKNLSAGRYDYRLKQIDRDGKYSYSQTVEVNIGGLPMTLELAQNYPNPFNPSTRIEFTVPEGGRATLKIYDLLGQEVATLFDGETESGRSFQTTFDATRLAGGIYFSKLQFNGKQLVRKMLMLK